MTTLGKILRNRLLHSALGNAVRTPETCCTLPIRSIHSSPIMQVESVSGPLKEWLSKFPKAPKPDQSHSMGSADTVYELQIHGVMPAHMEKYLKDYELFQNMMKEKKTGAELVGSFTVDIGDQDEAVHIWRYPGGYPVHSAFNTAYRRESDKDLVEYRKKRNAMLRYRRNQIMFAWNFWPKIAPRKGPHIYELRSYTLKPGAMYEWGNCWRDGIKNRRDKDEAVSGFYTQHGELNNVEHLWAYGDLQIRKETREKARSRPGWDHVVASSVPMIRSMKSRILVPTPFSPLQ